MIDVREHYKTTQCATCPISCGCSWGCLRGDDLAEIAELRAALKPLLEHYLHCYDGNKDALALEAESLLGAEQLSATKEGQ